MKRFLKNSSNLNFRKKDETKKKEVKKKDEDEVKNVYGVFLFIIHFKVDCM